MPRVVRNSHVVATAESLSANSGDDAETKVLVSQNDFGELTPVWTASFKSSGCTVQEADAIFKKYLEACAGAEANIAKDQVFDRGLARVRDYLSGAQGDSSVCLICLGQIGSREATWHCAEGCFAVLHLVCVQEWVRNQLDGAAAKALARLNAQRFPDAGADARAAADWGCPKCRQMYKASAVPQHYTCFCGKQEDPEWDPWIAPHTCGDLCGKQLASACGHECLLLCHPGPCPPCPLVVDAACYCGKRVIKRRCGHHEFSCSGTCGLALECGHLCQETCHPGECPPCGQQGMFSCQCGAEVRQVVCAQRCFQCRRLCSKALSCGHHSCEKMCHAGPCGRCPHEGKRSCPCGGVLCQDLPCTEKVPTCGETCGKVLPCGLHCCQERCHYGECSRTCRARLLKGCRCGKVQKEVPCHQELTCERRCASMRTCTRHACKRRCCDGNCPACDEPCGRRLKCGNHRCPALCHAGPCRPCPLTLTITCACGAVTRTLPCGAESRAMPPQCTRPCPVVPLCRHSAALPQHRCHYGPCPRCNNACGTRLPCNHVCSSSGCHDPAPPAVPLFVQPVPIKQLPVAAALATAAAAAADGAPPVQSIKVKELGRRPTGQASSSHGDPLGSRGATATAVEAEWSASAQAVAARAELAGTLLPECPPCRAPVPVRCMGGHTEQVMQCAQAHDYSCGQPCGAPLACSHHTCEAICHALIGVSSSDPQLPPLTCKQCERPCNQPRSCIHPCPQRCHSGRCAPCDALMRAACHCGKSSLVFSCADHQTYASQQSAAPRPSPSSPVSAAIAHPADLLCCGRACHRQLPRCPHVCQAMCHQGGCPECTQEVTVRCECKRLKKKWSCDLVLQTLQNAGRPSSYDAATPLRLLPCDDTCVTAKPAPTGATADPSSATADARNGGTANSARASVSAVAAVAKSKAVKAATSSATLTSVMATTTALLQPEPVGNSSKPATRSARQAEREVAAHAKEKERLRAARTARLHKLLVWLVIVLTGLVIGLGANWLLKQMDEAAQAKWRPVNV